MKSFVQWINLKENDMGMVPGGLPDTAPRRQYGPRPGEPEPKWQTKPQYDPNDPWGSQHYSNDGILSRTHETPIHGVYVVQGPKGFQAVNGRHEFFKNLHGGRDSTFYPTYDAAVEAGRYGIRRG
jgi:hypothetical protein